MNKETIKLYKSSALFKGCKKPERAPDYISFDKRGNVSSYYWYNKDSLVRGSNHWTSTRGFNTGVKNTPKHLINKVGSCRWYIKTNTTKKGIIYGKCKYSDFIIN